MSEKPGSRPRRAIGDANLTMMSQTAQGQVDGSAWSNPSGTSPRHQALIGIGAVAAVVGVILLFASGTVAIVVGVLLVLGGVAAAAFGVVGYRRDRAALRELAEQIEREQDGPVA